MFAESIEDPHGSPEAARYDSRYLKVWERLADMNRHAASGLVDSWGVMADLGAMTARLASTEGADRPRIQDLAETVAIAGHLDSEAAARLAQPWAAPAGFTPTVADRVFILEALLAEARTAASAVDEGDRDILRYCLWQATSYAAGLSADGGVDGGALMGIFVAAYEQALVS